MLNTDQKKILDTVLNAIDEKKGKFIFVDGPAGTGKTFLYKQLISHLNSINKSVIKTATTGIAADLIDGRTLHSVFKLPIPIFENCTSRLKENTPQSDQILESSLIIIDEVSLMSKHALNAINDILQRLTNKKEIFGGKVILLGGDFRQTANIIMKKKDVIYLNHQEKHSISGNLLKSIKSINPW